MYINSSDDHEIQKLELKKKKVTEKAVFIGTHTHVTNFSINQK